MLTFLRFYVLAIVALGSIRKLHKKIVPNLLSVAERSALTLRVQNRE
jgi:hypothetical protein